MLHNGLVAKYQEIRSCNAADMAHFQRRHIAMLHSNGAYKEKNSMKERVHYKRKYANNENNEKKKKKRRNPDNGVSVGVSSLDYDKKSPNRDFFLD